MFTGKGKGWVAAESNDTAGQRQRGLTSSSGSASACGVPRGCCGSRGQPTPCAQELSESLFCFQVTSWSSFKPHSQISKANPKAAECWLKNLLHLVTEEHFGVSQLVKGDLTPLRGWWVFLCLAWRSLHWHVGSTRRLTRYPPSVAPQLHNYRRYCLS